MVSKLYLGRTNISDKTTGILVTLEIISMWHIYLKVNNFSGQITVVEFLKNEGDTSPSFPSFLPVSLPLSIPSSLPLLPSFLSQVFIGCLCARCSSFNNQFISHVGWIVALTEDKFGNSAITNHSTNHSDLLNWGSTETHESLLSKVWVISWVICNCTVPELVLC